MGLKKNSKCLCPYSTKQSSVESDLSNHDTIFNNPKRSAPYATNTRKTRQITKLTTTMLLTVESETLRLC